MNQKIKPAVGLLLAAAAIALAGANITPESSLETTITYIQPTTLQQTGYTTEPEIKFNRHITVTYPSPTPEPTPTVTPSPTPIPTASIQSSDTERDLFIKIVAAEAGNWDVAGYWLIAQTIVNQMNNGYWGNTLTEVLTYGNNYSVYTNGAYNRQPAEKLATAATAVDMVLKGQSPQNLDISVATAETILYFCTTQYLNNNPGSFHATKCSIVTVYDNVTFFK